MEFHLLLLSIFAVLSLTHVASHAALSPQAYWHSVLPNTPMPQAVKNLLPQEANLRRSDKDVVGHIDFAKANVRRGDKDARAILYNVGRGDKDARAILYNVGRGDKDARAILYFAEASINRQLHYNLNETIYFLEEDIKQGTKMNLDLSKEANRVTFLPRTVAQSMPFSSNEFPKILNQFSVKPNSAEAKIMKKTIEVCTEMPAFKGELKYCATSLESMIDFCTSMLGKRVKALSTELEKETQLRKYSVVGFKKIGGDEVAVCHMLKYPYAVFSCHNVHSTKVYMVSLEDAEEGGTKATGVAVCHIDTAAWSPNFEAFQMLKVKPGTVLICHILPEDNIVWLPN
ncbi:BURP domain protein RD22-like [Camellia sinensis]|uniref:BURP domain protein RD22-like n=1 Tax=Camellia sinensis TaxID=4442 RepID=UPI001035FCF7|nr:BURP domain protein RD22-like [Camellia sinensis]